MWTSCEIHGKPVASLEFLIEILPYALIWSVFHLSHLSSTLHLEILSGQDDLDRAEAEVWVGIVMKWLSCCMMPLRHISWCWQRVNDLFSDVHYGRPVKVGALTDVAMIYYYLMKWRCGVHASLNLSTLSTVAQLGGTAEVGLQNDLQRLLHDFFRMIIYSRNLQFYNPKWIHQI